MINQKTIVWLLNVPLDQDHKNTIYFETLEQQTAYFASRVVFNSIEDGDNGISIQRTFSYQRKDGVIRYPKHKDELESCNYVMYTNEGDKAFPKWHYAFITDKQYKNDEATEIYIKTDPVQDRMFKKDGTRGYKVNASFIEREHVADDTPGLHTQEEGLQLGEYVCNLSNDFSGFTDLSIVIGVTEAWYGETSKDFELGWGGASFGEGEFKKISGEVYNGLPSGLAYAACPYSEAGMKQMKDLIEKYDSGKADAIQCLFLAPTALTGTGTQGGWVPKSVRFFEHYINLKPAYSDNYSLITLTSDKINNHEPNNKKLLTYPYRYLLVGNNNGVSVPYRFENFSDYEGNKNVEPQFIVKACLSPGCSIRLVPLNYNGVNENEEEGINGGKFPSLNWTSDVYTNWLTQNGVNIAIDVVSSIAMTALGVAAGVASGGAGFLATTPMIASGVSQVASTMGEINKMSMVPPQSKGNTNNGDIITISGQNTFHFYNMSIKEEYAKIIDGYFDMFGYKVNSVKVPNENHRPEFWYTKTIDVSITGDMDQGDLQELKNIYNNGITFWKNPDHVGDYSYAKDNKIS